MTSLFIEYNAPAGRTVQFGFRALRDYQRFELIDVLHRAPIQIEAIKKDINGDFHYRVIKQSRYITYEILSACLEYVHEFVKERVEPKLDRINFGEKDE